MSFKELTAQQKSTMTWRWAALSLYLLVCFYDFMFVPIWYGINRPDISQFMEIINSTKEPMVQMELMKKLSALLTIKLNRTQYLQDLEVKRN